MHHRIEFIKVSGAGNDFLLVDNLDMAYPIVDWGDFARSACPRASGVGTDGLVVLEPSRDTDFHMKYYNADGSTGAMCGNGGRCAARYAFLTGLTGPNIRFESNQVLYDAIVEHELVRLNLSDIKGSGTHAQVKLMNAEPIPVVVIDTGAPHIVARTENIDEIDVQELGRQLRHHPIVLPKGANADFFSIESQHEISVRTYERGVERETESCGTGVVASAISASLLGDVISPVRVAVRSGESLTVSFEPTGHGFRKITLTGSAHFIFAGVLLYDAETGRISPEAFQNIRAIG